MADPQIRFAVERALKRAETQRDEAAKMAEQMGITSLQLEAWSGECELLDAAVDILKGLEGG